MDYGHYTVPPSLTPLVKAVWFARGDAGAGAFADPIVPDGCVEVVFNLGDPFEQRSQSTGAVGSRRRFSSAR